MHSPTALFRYSAPPRGGSPPGIAGRCYGSAEPPAVSAPHNSPCIVCTAARCPVRPPLTRPHSSEALPPFCRASARTPASTSSPLTAANRPLCREVALPQKPRRLCRHWPLLAGEGNAPNGLPAASSLCVANVVPKTASCGGPAASIGHAAERGQGLQCWHRSHTGCCR
jgi:hypothetical protein